MGEIYSLGGGRITLEESIKIAEKLVKLSKAEEPNVTFLPTAKKDYKEYIESFDHIFGEKLKCNTKTLKLYENNPQESFIRHIINKSDIVYVGGGNTRMMLNKWEEKNVNQILRNAYSENEVIMSGWSAGGICWFDKGHSDSESYEKNGKWEYILIEGLGLVDDVTFCPHYRSQNRQKSFRKYVKKHDLKGLAVDDFSAVHIKENKMKVSSLREGSKVYVLYKENGGVQKKDITHLDHFIDINKVIKR